MTEKQLYRTPKEPPVLKAPFVTGVPKKAPRKASAPQNVSVCPIRDIPEGLLDYFKMDPRTRAPLLEDEKNLHAQVFIHEIEEGARLLVRAGQKKDAKILCDFSNHLHANQRLDLLRRRLEEVHLLKASPEHIQQTYKARNNQWGAIKARMGQHPAVAYTEMGIGYKNVNEDAFLLMPSQKVLALADGLGGHSGGDIASGMAIDFFEYGIQNGMEIERAIAYANDAILIRGKSDPNLGGMHPMGCTFAAVQLKHSLLSVAHVGDTKILVIREGEIFYESEDHTKGQELFKEGLVDLPTAFELNHILNRCLGLDKMQCFRDVALSKIELEPGDRILIITDGISDNFFGTNFHLDQIASLVSNGALSHAADVLIDTCHQRMVSPTLPNGRPGKPDNLSLAMLEYRG